MRRDHPPFSEPPVADGSRGFALIEVFLAFAILSVGILAMMAAQVQAVKGGQKGRHLTQATVLARDHLEFLHRLDWNDPLLADTSAAAGPPAGYNASVAVDNTVQGIVPYVEQTYNRQERIVDVAPNLKSISVAVSWTEADGRFRSHVVSSVRHNDP